ncbi:hypothetical protein SNEBB_006065 [Seison nebaliae]|nr:hypothetical protein SNEBB_006065 [Seison nebaliae]
MLNCFSFGYSVIYNNICTKENKTNNYTINDINKDHKNSVHLSLQNEYTKTRIEKGKTKSNDYIDRSVTVDQCRVPVCSITNQ